MTAAMFSVRLDSGRQFAAEPGQSLLDAAAVAGIALSYSCKTGRCSTCKARVVEGQTVALQAETGLTAAEQEAGWILSCVRAAGSDLMLEADDLGAIALPPARTVPCRVNSLELLAPDVLRVLLRLPPTAQFDFIAGQYVDVIGPGGVRRSYSVANAPGAGKTIELHIRAVEGGVMSAYWFGQAKVNDLLRLHGPLGTFFLRDVADSDLVLLATGTGIAPVKAMLEAMPALPETERPRSVTVLWGGRSARDLYMDVGAIAGARRFVPVLSRGADDWSGARGHVQDVLLGLKPDLSNAAVYACGSDSMIHSAKELLVQAGLPAARFHSDAFVCSATNTSV